MDRYTASPPEGQAFSSGTCSWAPGLVYYSQRLLFAVFLANGNGLQVKQLMQMTGAAWMASSFFDGKNPNQMCLTEVRETISCNPERSWSRGDAADGMVKKPANQQVPAKREREIA